MKRILSLMLALCLLVVSGAMLASCSATVDMKKAEENANAVLGEALAKTEILSDEAGLGAALEAVMDAGAVELDWKASALDMGYPDIKATLYADRDAGKAVLDASLKGEMMGEDPDAAARLYLSGETLMLNSPALLGSDRTLALNFATLEEKLADSPIADLFQLDEEDVAEAIAAIDGLREMLDDCFASVADESKEQADAFMNEIYALLDQSVSEGKVKNGAGEEVDCVILTYTVNGETLARVSNHMMGIEAHEEETEETDADAEESAGVDLVVCVRIEKSSGALAGVSLAGEVRREEYAYGNSLFGETVTVTSEINAAIFFSENAISASIAQTTDGETTETSVTLTKKTEGNEILYVLAAEADEKKSADVTLSYNKKSGAVALTGKTYDDEGEEDQEVEIKGSIVTDNAGTVITVDTYKSGAVTIELGLTLSFLKDAEMPEFPTDATDVVTMSDEELAAVMEEMQGGLLGMFLFGFGF